MNPAVATLLALLTGAAPAPIVSRTTPHLTFTAALSEGAVAPGARISMVVDVVPRQGMHVYAPGSEYRPVAISIAPHSLLRVHDAVYPKPTLFTFKPLNEDVLVYDAPFRLVIDVTVGETAAKTAAKSTAQQARLRSQVRVPIKGRLDYQACDDHVCYLPASVPFEWTVKIKR